MEKDSHSPKHSSFFSSPSSETYLYRIYKKEALETNKKFIGLLLLCSLVINLSILISRIWVPGRDAYSEWILSSTQFGISLLMAFLYRPVIKKYLPAKYSQIFSYLYIALLFVISILSSTFFVSHDLETFSFLLITVTYPVFIIDTPWRKILFTLLFLTIYSFCDYYGFGLPNDTTYYNVFLRDMTHQLEFAAASFILQYLINRLVLEQIQSQQQAEKNARIHSVSDILNRYALLKDTPNYLGHVITMLMLDIDNFKYFNDLYGHQVGDEVLFRMGKKLKEIFGTPYSYSFGGDEFLIVTPLLDTEEKVKKTLDAFYQEGISFSHNGQRIKITFSIGYVVGKPITSQDLLDKMELQADQYLYRSKDKGRNQYSGGIFDPEKKSKTRMLSGVINPLNSAVIDPLTRLPTPIYFREKVKEDLLTSDISAKKMVIAYFSFSDYHRYEKEKGKEASQKLLLDFATSLRLSYPHSLLCHSSGSHFYLFTTESNLQKTVPPLIDEAELLTGEDQTLMVGYAYASEPNEVSETCTKARLDVMEGREYLRQIGQEKPIPKKA